MPSPPPPAREVSPRPSHEREHAPDEEEPLLGRPGDVTQRPSDLLLKNLILGTAPLAQVGGITLVAITWGGVFTHRLILFSAHPLLNSLGLLLGIQALLILQPTHTAEQKRSGTLMHFLFWASALATFYAALVVVEVHKQRGGIGHFESPHAVLGIVIYVLLLIQAWVGVAQYFFPAVFGGVERAKRVYKYHRIAGYVLVLLLLVNVVLATKTYYAGKVLGIRTWAAVVGSLLVVAGIAPRIKKQKIRLWTNSSST
ncbi:hypothetical protein FN846DRAFT_909282 [Sphaerosporella brunnea]|uniref:Cytochrome b561 domain-containing protein n=1 Tax=Sphaerosporella brunnea TaxID=1250544 RepID=A0A5J5ERE0_9PEZI|nr:hypothetical protein FN846DRAFT_909282 [Sphaerosporella brunnea]